MALPISSLANMEYMLYGGMAGANSACPSYANGYMANSNAWAYPYGNYGNYTQQYPNMYNQAVMQPQNQNIFTKTNPVQNNVQKPAITNNELDTLGKFYEKSNSMELTWDSLPMSAAMIAFTENAQNIKHFWNSRKAIGITNKVFDMKNPAVKALWTKNPELMQNAYGQLHAINRNAQTKRSFIQKWFQEPIDDTTRKHLSGIMEKAIKSNDEKLILEATETLKASRGMDGYIPTAWNKVKNFFGFKGQNYTPLERIKNKQAEIDKAVNAPKAIKPGFGGLVKQGLKEGKMFAAFGLLIDLPKIISAYQNGGATSATTQVAQTGIRAIADGIGWTLGRAAGGAIGTKLGATIGTAICPGIGTAVGAALGFVGGALGSIVASKITHAFMPTDEATKLEANNLKKTPEGQVQLIQLALEKAQSGEEVPQNVMFAAQNVASKMSA